MVGPSVVKHLSFSETAWSWRHAEFPSFTVQHVHSRYIEQLVGKLLDNDTFCCVASVDVTEVETLIQGMFMDFRQRIDPNVKNNTLI